MLGAVGASAVDETFMAFASGGEGADLRLRPAPMHQILSVRLGSIPPLRRVGVAACAIALRPFAVAATAASAVCIEASVVALVLGLADLTIHLDVVDLHVAVAPDVREV